MHVCLARMRNEKNDFVCHIGKPALPSVDESVTDLGVTYDSILMFRPHIDNIVSKAVSVQN